MDTQKLGLTQLSQLPALPVMDDTDIGGPPLQRTFSGASSNVINPLLAEIRRPIVTEDCMRDPINDSFFLDTWHQVAENNTKLFRQVFRCQPDNEVKTWKEYQEYTTFAARFSQMQGGGKPQNQRAHEAPGKTGPPGTGVTEKIGLVGNKVGALGDKLSEKVTNNSDNLPSKTGAVEQWAHEQEKRIQQGLKLDTHNAHNNGEEFDEKHPHSAKPADDSIVSPMNPNLPDRTYTFPAAPPIPDNDPYNPLNSHNPDAPRARNVTINEPLKHSSTAPPANNFSSHRNTMGSKRSRRRATTKSSTRAFHASDADSMLNKEDSKMLMDLVQGHLVLWPYEWLESEERGGGWLYNVDQIAPLEI